MTEMRPDAARIPNPGDRIKSRFTLIKVLGAGNFGTVFEARDENAVRMGASDPYIAVKILDPHILERLGGYRALRQEFEWASRMSHPNVVKLYDCDLDEYFQVAFITMEYLQGVTLRQRIEAATEARRIAVGLGKATRPECLLPRMEAGPIVCGMARAVGHVHASGCVHKDIKPENVFLTTAGRVVLMDFGLARAIDIGETLTPLRGALTPAYASLEMLRWERAEPRDDLYSLGCVVYELLTGKHPFNRVPATDVFQLRRDGRPVEPARPPEISGKTWKTLKRYLALERHQRPADVADLLAVFEDVPRRRWRWPWQKPLAPPRPVAVLRNEQTANETDAWLNAQAGRNPAVIEAFLRCYPESRYAELAKERLGELRQNAAPDTVPMTEPAVEAWSTDQAKALQQAAAQQFGLASAYFRDALSDGSMGPELAIVPAGRFRMGSPAGEPGRTNDEHPPHSVHIGRPFAIGRCPVTFAQFDRFCAAAGRALPSDAGWGRGERPVIYVTWGDADAYCRWLSEVAGKVYRLPTEAEWEHACRAGCFSAWSWGEDGGAAESHAWFSANANDRTQPVGGKAPNPFGLHDMAGNVWEWQADHWHEDYRGAPTDGSAWLDAGRGADSVHVVRGGAWILPAAELRSANRGRVRAVAAIAYLGFRVVREI